VIKRTFVLILLVGLVVPTAGQSNLSIQGVWRPVELTVPAPNGRRDPFGAFGEGTYTNLQPELMIFTAKYYSRTTDTASHPRPTSGYKIAGKPTLDELQAEWGPFAANAGTYEFSSTTLTLRTQVSKDPRGQREQNFTRLTVKLDGNNLWLSPTETDAGQIAAPVCIKFVRVE
jgi:hypothetical protein